MSKFILFIAVAIVSTQAFAFMYGPLDHRPITDYLHTPYGEMARSVGAMIDKKLLEIDPVTGNGYLTPFQLKNKNLSGQMSESGFLCSDQPMVEEDAQASCTFSLVGEDLVLTAAHCLINDLNVKRDYRNPVDTDCQSTRFAFVFGYDSLMPKVNDKWEINNEDIYQCKTIKRYNINYAIMGRDQPDYMLIQLDRKVKNRTPLKLSQEARKAGQPIISIGHPVGVSQRITDRGQIVRHRSQTTSYYAAELDAHPGSSGSPVIDTTNGEIVGVVAVAATPFFQKDEDRGCMYFHGCPRSSSSTQICNTTMIAKSTVMSEIYDQVESDNSFAKTFSQFYNDRLRLAEEEEQFQEKAQELKNFALRSLQNSNSNQSLMTQRRVGQRISKISSTITKPFAWSAGFFKGLIKSPRRMEVEQLALKSSLYQTHHYEMIMELLADSKTQKEFNQKAQDYVEEAIFLFLTNELQMIALKMPEKEVLQSPKSFKAWLNQCSECTPFIEATGITDRHFYLRLKETSEVIDFADTLLVQEKLSQLIIPEVSKTAVGTTLASLVSSTLGTIYFLPVAALQAGATVSHIKCLNKKGQERMNWYEQMQQLRMNHDETFNDLVNEAPQLKVIFQDAEHFTQHCTTLLTRSYLESQKSQAKGESVGRKLKGMIRLKK
jgi:V8-like Glu-specific endopeptidase